jgi:hypothetical protein
MPGADDCCARPAGCAAGIGARGPSQTAQVRDPPDRQTTTGRWHLPSLCAKPVRNFGPLPEAGDRPGCRSGGPHAGRPFGLQAALVLRMLVLRHVACDTRRQARACTSDPELSIVSFPRGVRPNGPGERSPGHRGRRPMPWVGGLTMRCGLKGRGNPTRQESSRYLPKSSRIALVGRRGLVTRVALRHALAAQHEPPPREARALQDLSDAASYAVDEDVVPSPNACKFSSPAARLPRPDFR